MNDKNLIEEKRELLDIFSPSSLSFEEANMLTDTIIETGYRKQEWISVDEKLPEVECPVLVFTKRKRCYVGYYFKESTNRTFAGFYAKTARRDVTHWMPLPELPKGSFGIISRAELRGKPLDKECYEAKLTSHKYGIEDVVPKSEAAKLSEINSLLTEAGQEWQRRYNDAKAEAVKEVFEEIEKYLLINARDIALISHKTLDAIKEKYLNSAS